MYHTGPRRGGPGHRRSFNRGVNGTLTLPQSHHSPQGPSTSIMYMYHTGPRRGAPAIGGASTVAKTGLSHCRNHIIHLTSIMYMYHTGPRRGAPAIGGASTVV